MMVSIVMGRIYNFLHEAFGLDPQIRVNDERTPVSTVAVSGATYHRKMFSHLTSPEG